MGVTITTRLPEKLVKEIKEISNTEQLDKSEVVRRLLSESIHQWRIRKALEMYKKESYSLGEASEFAAVSHWELFQLLKKYKLNITYDTEEFEHDLKMIGWKKQ